MVADIRDFLIDRYYLYKDSIAIKVGKKATWNKRFGYIDD